MYLLHWLKEWYNLTHRRAPNLGRVELTGCSPLQRIRWLEARFAEHIVSGACPIDSPVAAELAELIHALKSKYPNYFRKELL